MMNFKTGLYTALAAAVAVGAGSVHAQGGREDAPASELGQSEDDLIMAERRQELIREADRALDALRRQNELAAALMEAAYGHAVFNTTKGGLIVTGAGGTGVARSNIGDVTFMRLGSAGIGLGAGFENYKLVLLFEDEDTYSRFVSGQWDGSLSAQAAAGSEGVAAHEQFIGGIRAFRLTDGGLMAQVDATAMRFWPVDRLNRAAEIEQRIAAASGGEVPPAIEESLSASSSDSEREQAFRASAPSNPEWLDEIAAERDDLGLFVEAVKAAGLADALTSDTAYTVFAPTDAVFESMSGMTRDELLAPENRDELVRLLRAHIVADDLDREMARNVSEALTIDGGTVAVDAAGDTFTVGAASVVEPDLRRGNLRVHVVDDFVAAPIQVAEADLETAPDAAEPASPDDAESRSVAPLDTE